MTRTISHGLLVLSALLLMFSVYIHFRAGYYGDKEWELLYARMWLDGKVFYRDIFPVSPPLIFWVYAFPAWLGMHFTQLRDFEWLVILGLLVISASLFLCLRVLSLSLYFRGKNFLVWFGILFCFLLVFRTYPSYFLDREHLFLVLIFPYLLRFMPRICTEKSFFSLSVVTGVLAGFGFSFKPQCLVIAIGIQAICCLYRKSYRSLFALENIAAAVTGLGYLVAVACLYPDYIHVVMPMGLETYSATRDENSAITYSGNALSVLIVTFLLFPWTRDSPLRRDIFYVLALCPFCLLYALANNNWSYTYYPLNTLSLLICGFVLWDFLALRRQYPTQRRYRLWFLLGAALCAGNFIFRVFLSFDVFQFVLSDSYVNYLRGGNITMFADEVTAGNRPHSFGTISIDFDRWTKLSDYTGARWETRFPQLWMLPKFFTSDDAFYREHKWIIRYLGEAYAYDLNHNIPEVVFVDDSDKFYTAHKQEDLVAYLRAVPEFNTAWAHYHFNHKINFCGPANGPYPHKFQCSYDVYDRNP